MSDPSSDTVVTLCPNCQKRLRLPRVQPGKKVRCADCDTIFPFEELQPQAPVAQFAPEDRGTGADVDSRTARSLTTPDDFDDGEDRPRRRKPRDEDDEDEEDRPRRKKRRRKSRSSHGGGFDLLEALPMEYAAQAQLALPIALVFNILGLIFTIAKNEGVSTLFYLLCLPFWFWACAATARNQGRSAFNCFYGLLGPIGFLIVATSGNQS